MKIILEIKDINLEDEKGQIMKDWIQTLVDHKETSNISPLRYADEVKFTE